MSAPNPQFPSAGTDATAPSAEATRRATWFELFFDLVFVAGIAGMSTSFVEHYDVEGAARFSLVFLILWWAWIGHTFYATRFDRDTPRQRLLGALQMAAIVIASAGAEAAFDGHGGAFVAGIAAYKSVLGVQFALHIKDAPGGGVARAYSVLYTVAAVAWLATLWLPSSQQIAVWVTLAGAEIIAPVLLRSFTEQMPPHREHLPERFGLFTIILIGELAAAALHGLHNTHPLTWSSAISGILAIGIATTVWWGYFHRVGGAEERRVIGTASAKRLRAWAYVHGLLYLGVAGTAVGVQRLVAGSDTGELEHILFAASLATTMLGLTVLGALSEISLGRLAAGLHTAVSLIALATLATVIGSASLTLAMALGFCLLQLVISVAMRNRAVI